jgi:hypothetical protein
MPIPDFAVPYEAPKHVNTMAEVQPIVPKNGLQCISGPDQGVTGSKGNAGRSSCRESFITHSIDRT